MSIILVGCTFLQSATFEADYNYSKSPEDDLITDLIKIKNELINMGFKPIQTSSPQYGYRFDINDKENSFGVNVGIESLLISFNEEAKIVFKFSSISSRSSKYSRKHINNFKKQSEKIVKRATGKTLFVELVSNE